MSKLIINADDLGLSSNTNDAIFTLMDNDIISSATLLANGPAFDEAINLAKFFPSKSFGLHLNLTEFEPVDHKTRRSKLCGLDGNFNLSNEERISFIDLNVVAIELSAQVEKFLSTGLRLSHIDSHHHIHTRPLLFPVLKYLINKYNIKKVRGTRNLMPERISQYNLFDFKVIKKRCWTAALKISPPNVITTDFFGSVSDYLLITQSGLYKKFLNFNENTTIELMCHPGSNCFEFLEEEKFLKQNPEFSEDNNHRLINYWDL